ncbi:MAG: hypothetical protein K0S94_2814 [Nitrospira sp.]|nr:hypothetical protein [Nitrospira sp.]
MRPKSNDDKTPREMTVITDELIEILKRYPGMRVCVNGYEEGYDDPRPQVRHLVPDKDPEWTDGEYREKKDIDPSESGFVALVLFRNPESVPGEKISGIDRPLVSNQQVVDSNKN